MTPRIFISYRREDSEYAAHAIYKRLVERYGEDAVFMDVHRMKLGLDFREQLSDAVGRCHLLLAIIGDYWVDIKEKEGPRQGERRLEDPGDFVRIEITSALQSDIPVIPVLVGRADVPKAAQLPDDMREFASRQATYVRAGADFDDHVERLIRDLDELLQTLHFSDDEEPPPAGGMAFAAKHTERPSHSGTHSVEYFHAQREVIEQATGAFIGRTYVDRALDEFIGSHNNGYFLIQGGPGQGKSFVSCHLIKSRQGIHHLISRDGGRSDSRLIFRSIIAQLLDATNERRSIPDNLTEMQKLFEELLTKLSSREQPVIIVVDALNELSDPAEHVPPFFITRGLPRNIYFVVTSRLGERLIALERAVSGTPQENYSLGPLQLDEMGAMLRSRLPHLTDEEVERIADVSGGNPLYLRAVADELQRNAQFDLQRLPADVEGFFHEATRDFQRGRDESLNQVLGLLSVARKSLSIPELSRITGIRYREIDEGGIQPIRQFLFHVDNSFAFYHARFHEFVTDKLFYRDELAEYHQLLADWLERLENHRNDYRFQSLAYHLSKADQPDRIAEVINESFLAEKVQRYGYSVLEDIELLTHSMLDAGDPALVERCVGLIDSLRAVVGGDLIDDSSRSLRHYRPGPEAFRSRVIAPSLPRFEGLDVYVGMLPKAEVGADFFEIIPNGNHLVAAIGDAPGTGLKSAFVARFLGNLFRRLIADAPQPDLARALEKLNHTISAHEYFETVSMQCVDVDPVRGILTIASAGHPYPVLYSARRGDCDRLPVRGALLHAAYGDGEPVHYEQRLAEIAPGDILLLISDGLTEDHQLIGKPYGYRFQELVKQYAGESAAAIGEAILDDWRAYPREGDYADDVTLIVASVKT